MLTAGRDKDKHGGWTIRPPGHILQTLKQTQLSVACKQAGIREQQRLASMHQATPHFWHRPRDESQQVAPAIA